MPKRSDMKFCSEGCSVKCAKEKYYTRIRRDRGIYEYGKVYKRLQARVRRQKLDSESFEQWRKEAKDKLNAYRAGKLDVVAFVKWLQDTGGDQKTQPGQESTPSPQMQ